MGKFLRVLMVEDSEDHVLLTVRTLKADGYELTYERLEDAQAMRDALWRKPWDVILCDYQMPKFNAPAAIALLKETGIDVPIIIVSGAIGEEMAVECMRLGARDYIMKGNLLRLAPAIEREMKEATSRLKRREAEDELRASEERFKAIFNQGPLGIALIDAMTGQICSANPMVARMSGRTTEEIVRMDWMSLTHPDDVREALGHVSHLNSGRIKSFRMQMRWLLPDDSIIWVSITVSPLATEDSLHPLHLYMIADITQHRRAEEELQDTLESLRKAIGATIQVMVAAVERRDPYTAGHQCRSADLARAIATKMGLSLDKINGIRMACSIHDIGGLAIPSEILSKPSKLTNTEFRLVQEHARQGFEILEGVESPWPLAEIVYQHHERMDGSGYPRHLKGDDILLESRILSVADVVEAIASHRPYRSALGVGAALEEIEKNSGILYDAAVADACLRLFREDGYQLP